MLTIRNKADVAEIYISGDIVDDADGAWLSHNWNEGDTTGYEFPQKLRAQLDAISADTPLEVHINSCGGSVFAGVAMANFIANHKGKTTAIVDGIAASIASQIFFAADVCKIPANGYIMIHKPFTEIIGNATDLRKAADILDTIQQGLETTYIPKMRRHLCLNDLREMMEAETWLTGEEAANIFDVQVLSPVKALNAVGNIDKLKAMGITVPPSLNFSNEVDPRTARLKRIRERWKENFYESYR